MSKVICDVCGTTFSETESQCPVCGCAKAADSVVSTSEASKTTTERTVATSYAKGGRYAKGNAKRAPGAFAAPKSESKPAARRRNNEPQQQSNKGLVAVVIVLLLAIILVVVYIGVVAFLPGPTGQNDNNQNSSPQQTDPSTDPSGSEGVPNTDPTGSDRIACTELTLGNLVLELDKENMQVLLRVTTEPANTTDSVRFSIADESVATVDENGLVTPVGYGQTVLTVTCGDKTAQCTVTCTFGAPVTEPPTEPVPTAPVGFVLELNRTDFTLSKEGEKWRLFKDTDTVKASDITWTVEDPSIATVENGVVTGVDRGQTKVTAQLGDQVVTCIVRCAFDAAEPTEPTGITISKSDVTLKSGESFYLTLKNEDGSKVQNIEWLATEEGLVDIDGSNITALEIEKKVTIEVYTEYEGVRYACIVRLYPADKDET